MAEFYYGNGMNIGVARKWFQFYFEDFFFQAKKNMKERRFDIYLFKTITTEENNKKEVVKIEDYFNLDNFNNFWAPQFHLILINEEEF